MIEAFKLIDMPNALTGGVQHGDGVGDAAHL